MASEQFWFKLFLCGVVSYAVGLVFTLPAFHSLGLGALGGVIYVLPVTLAVAVCGVAFWKPLRRALRKDLANNGEAVCVDCGYDLRGLSRPRCPECGAAFDEDLLKR